MWVGKVYKCNSTWQQVFKGGWEGVCLIETGMNVLNSLAYMPFPSPQNNLFSTCMLSRSVNKLPHKRHFYLPQTAVQLLITYHSLEMQDNLVVDALY